MSRPRDHLAAAVTSTRKDRQGGHADEGRAGGQAAEVRLTKDRAGDGRRRGLVTAIAVGGAVLAVLLLAFGGTGIWLYSRAKNIELAAKARFEKEAQTRAEQERAASEREERERQAREQTARGTAAREARERAAREAKERAEREVAQKRAVGSERPISVSAGELLAAYAANPAAADQQYKGRLLQITGKVSGYGLTSVGAKILPGCSVTMDAIPRSTGVTHISCTMPKGDEATAIALRFYPAVTLQGRCQGRVGNRVEVVDCVAVATNVAPPKPPGAKEGDGWEDAQDSSVLAGGVLIRITAGSLWRVKMTNPLGPTNWVLTDDNYLMLVLKLVNRSGTKKVDYEGWARGRPLPTLKDNYGNYYKLVSPPLGHEFIGQVTSPRSLNPGEGTEDLLVFQRPVDSAAALYLTLPAGQIQAAKDARFLIRPDFVTYWKKPNYVVPKQKSPSETVMGLVAGLKSPVVQKRRSAAHMLYEESSKAKQRVAEFKVAAAALGEALQDKDEGVRVNAARALWSLDRDSLARVLPVLVAGIKSTELAARQEAALGLSEIGAPAKEAVADLAEMFLSEGDAQACTSVAKALKAMGPEGLAAQQRLSQELVKDLRTSNPAKRFRAAERVEMLGAVAKDAVPGLVVMLDDAHEPSRFQAAAALASIGPDAKAAVLWLAALARKDRSVRVRAKAKEALKAIQGS